MADGEQDESHGGVEELDEGHGDEEVDVDHGDGEVAVVVDEGSGGVAVEVVVEGRGFATAAFENLAGNGAEEGFDCRVWLLQQLSSCLKAICPRADSKEPPVQHAAPVPLCCQF